MDKFNFCMDFYTCLFGTGSYPPVEAGLHLIILFIDKVIPFKKPNLSKEIIAYSEQDG